MEKMTIKEMQKAIIELKKAKQAVVLAHYYQLPEIQAVADYVGDSLALSTIAKETNAHLIVFCGVHFMAETAKILNPAKKVLLAHGDAGCPIADMIDEIKLASYKAKNPETTVVAYINTSAAVKALADVVVTSSNALKVIGYMQKQGKSILYVPDRHLANYANSLLPDNLPKLNLWPGYCPIHDEYSLKMVEQAKAKKPDALLLVHPEAPLEVLEAADFVGSTQGIVNFVERSDKRQFIIGTENGIIEVLKQKHPTKTFVPLNEKAVCPDMKKTTLDELHTTLLSERNEITLDNEIIAKAGLALNKMYEIQAEMK